MNTLKIGFVCCFILFYPKGLLSQDKINIQKSFETIMDSIIIKNPHDLYYIEEKSFFALDKVGKERTCFTDFSSFDIKPQLNEFIHISDSKKKYFRRNNFFNKIIYGNKLKMVALFQPLENKLGTHIFIIIIYDKHGGVQYITTLNNSTKEIIELCVLPFIG